MKIFVSYASGDRLPAEEIAISLRDWGNEVFLDRDDLRAGEGFRKSIAQAANKSEFFILLIGRKSVAEGRSILFEEHQDANEGALSEWVDTVNTLKTRTAREEADAEDAFIQRILQTDYESLRQEYVSRGLNPDHAIATIDSAIKRVKSVQRAKLEVSGDETRVPLQATNRVNSQAEIIAFSGHGSPSSGEAIGPHRNAVRDRVRTLWRMLSLQYAIASTAAIIFIFVLVWLLSFLHGSRPPNYSEQYGFIATSKDAELVVISPSTPQAGIDLCNELRESFVCSRLPGGKQGILVLSMPRDKVADFCKKIEANGNACQSSFIAIAPDTGGAVR
jgi:hypothetical protein